MLNKLSIEKLERIKELAIENQEYGIAKEIFEEIKKRPVEISSISVKIEEAWQFFDLKNIKNKSYLQNCEIVLNRIAGKEFTEDLHKYSKTTSC